jgi:hypothetical protein
MRDPKPLRPTGEHLALLTEPTLATSLPANPRISRIRSRQSCSGAPSDVGSSLAGDPSGPRTPASSSEVYLPEGSAWTENEAPRNQEGFNHALRLLSRWLVTAARKGAPVADSPPVDDPQNHLDVGSEAKVGSVSETAEMPVQQAFRKDIRR